MSLNEWLCRNFEKDEDGNVTIKNIFVGLFTPLRIMIAILIWCIGVVVNLYLTFSDEIPQDPKIFALNSAVYGFYIFISVVAMIRIGKISVAKCPLKYEKS